MAQENSLYDVLIYGCELTGAERDTAVHKLAQLLKCEPQNAEKLLLASGTPLKRGIPAEKAEQIVQILSTIGVNSNYRPSQDSGVKLELEAVEESESKVVCPACGHRHEVAPGAMPPVACEECHVVFSKYDTVAQLKSEREAIKRRLLNEYQRTLAEQAAELKRQEEAERRRQIEEDLRKDLGLPKFVTTRQGVINSAAAIFVLGLALGGSAAYFLQPGAPEATGSNGVTAAAIDRLDPADFAHIEAKALSEQTAKAASQSDAAPETTTRTQAALVPTMLQELPKDPEWDRHLAGKAEAALAKGEVGSAVALAAHIRGPQTRIAEGARLAQSLAKAGKTREAASLFDRLTGEAEILPEGQAARVGALCEIAGRQAKPGTTLNAAKLISDHITDPAAKAVAEEQLGAARMRSGGTAEARAAFLRANQAVASITDPLDRALTLARTARAYAKAGSRGGAATLLEDVVKAAGSLPMGDRRTAVLEEAIQTYGEMGDTAAALQAADMIQPESARDRAIHGLIVADIARGSLGSALEAAQSIKTPAYRARAVAFLGVAQQDDPHYRALAQASIEEAAAAAETIRNPAEKLAVLSEVARYASRGLDGKLADKLFAEAEQLAAGLPASADRDAAHALIAANQARALRSAEANKRLTQLQDPALMQSLSDDLAAVKAAGLTLKP